jgi:hypothetical protein
MHGFIIFTKGFPCASASSGGKFLTTRATKVAAFDFTSGALPPNASYSASDISSMVKANAKLSSVAWTS